jgi:hypothetical protein
MPTPLIKSRKYRIAEIEKMFINVPFRVLIDFSLSAAKWMYLFFETTNYFCKETVGFSETVSKEKNRIEFSS